MIAHQQGPRRQFTDTDYVDSIEDPFFKSIARQVVDVDSVSVDKQNTIGDIENAATANKRLEDLEVTIRRKLFELLLLLQESSNHNSNDRNKNTINTGTAADTIGAFWKSSLDLCHHFVHFAFFPSSKLETTVYEKLAPCRRLPFLLLSDCLEGLPSLEDAQRFWKDYVEPELRQSVLFGDKFWSQLTKSNNSKKLSLPSSHLPFLKVANQFLKRLDHASDNGVRVEWKGRIMWALSKGFSIVDKSSLKSWGHFHVSNGTDFESKEEFNEHITVDVPTSTNRVEYNLYDAFWSLQNDFANPNKLNVGSFIKRLRLILSAMESVTVSSNSTFIPEYTDEDGGIDKQTTKYLTSSALIPTQIQDPVFRSSVVTQFLIVACHLGAESPPLKNALASLLERARKILMKDFPLLHRILWESILIHGREGHWRTWKKLKCAANTFAPSFKRNQELFLESAPANDDHRDRSKSQQKRMRLTKEDEKDSIDEVLVSSLSRKFLGNNDRIAYSKEMHGKLPTLKEHLEPYVEALDPESGIEDEYHPKHDSLFTWRAMRLFAKNQLPLMSQCRQPADLEIVTREWHRQSLGTDIPGGIPVLNQSDKIDDNKDDNVGGGDQNGDDRIDIVNMDVECEDNEVVEGTKKERVHEKNDNGLLHTIDDDQNQVNVEIQETGHKKDLKLDDEQPNIKNKDATITKRREIESVNAKKDDSGPINERLNRSEPAHDSKATRSKIDNDDERTPKARTTEASKSSTATSTTLNDRKNDEKQNINSNTDLKNKNDDQRQEKRSVRENVPTQNRGGGWRGNDGGRERGRRDDGPSLRRRSDDNTQLRGGGRSSGDFSYRGRGDGPSPRGGRYDEEYRGESSRHHGDTRGDRFTVERTNRSTGRDNHRDDDRVGGIGRDDNRGGDRVGDRNRRNTDDRSRIGGAGRRRR